MTTKSSRASCICSDDVGYAMNFSVGSSVGLRGTSKFCWGSILLIGSMSAHISPPCFVLKDKKDVIFGVAMLIT